MLANLHIYIFHQTPRSVFYRLQPLLIQVNSVEMTGKSQSEAVSQLRSIPEGHMCNLVVSRQEVVDELFRMPRELVGHQLILFWKIIDIFDRTCTFSCSFLLVHWS